MTELQAVNVRITGDATGLSAAVTRATGDLAKVDAAAKKVTTSTAGTGAAVASMGTKMARVDGKQLSWQLSQIAQQGAATGQWAQAFAIQLGDIVPLVAGTGALATGIGLLAMVGLPMLANAFLSGKDASKEFGEALDAMVEHVAAFRTAASDATQSVSNMLDKFGVASPILAQALSDLAGIERVKAFEAIDATTDSMAELISTMSSEGGMAGAVQTFLGFTRNSEEARVAAYNFRVELERLAASEDPIEKLRGALNLRDQLVAATGAYKDMNAEQRSVYDGLTKTIVQLQLMGVNIDNATNGMSAFGNAASGAQGQVGTLVSQTRALAEAAMAAGAAMSAMAPPDMTPEGGYAPSLDRFGNPYAGEGGNAPSSSTRPRKRPDLVAGVDWGYASGGSSGGGGGGGGENPIIGELEALQESLMTQEEAQLASFTRQQEILQAALAQRLITQQEYNAMMEAAQGQHAEAMAEIDVMRYGTGLEKTAAYFGAISDIMASGNKKMMAVSQAFGAGQAWISTLVGAAKELEKGTFGFASAALVISKGAAFVSAIKGIGGGGGSGVGKSGASAAAAGPSQMPMQVQLNTYGAGDFIRGADFGLILDRLNSEAGDRGYNLMWRPT